MQPLLNTEVGEAQSHASKPWVWWLIVIWLAYSGAVLWHQKERGGWVASVCSASPQQ